jgi:hypothetical protein
MSKRHRSRNSLAAVRRATSVGGALGKQYGRPRKCVSRGESVATSPASKPSLEEFLAFERVLSDLSARFANVAVGQVIAEIEGALVDQI